MPDRNNTRWSNCRLRRWRVDAAVSQFRLFERMRDCSDRVANRARLGNAFVHALAFLLISQILNEMSYFHPRTDDHDPKSKVDFPRERWHRALPIISIRRVVETMTYTINKNLPPASLRRDTRVDWYT
jgi:hypothetical protein